MRTVTTLSADDATVMIAAAEKKANDIGVPMCISVVDAAGHLLAFKRMDGGKIHSVEVSRAKAFTAASTRVATGVLQQKAQPGQSLFGIQTQQGERFCIVGGGLPLYFEGDCIGGVGVSSGSADEDLSVATAAVEALLH